MEMTLALRSGGTCKRCDECARRGETAGAKSPRWRYACVFHIKEATVTGVWLVRGGEREDVVGEVSKHRSHWVGRPL